MHTPERLRFIAQHLHVRAMDQESNLLQFQFEQLANAYEQVAATQDMQRQRERIAALGLQDCLPEELVNSPSAATR